LKETNEEEGHGPARARNPGPFQARSQISRTGEEGLLVDSFRDSEEAEEFALERGEFGGQRDGVGARQRREKRTV
jgi:hypothetical protein